MRAKHPHDEVNSHNDAHLSEIPMATRQPYVHSNSNHHARQQYPGNHLQNWSKPPLPPPQGGKQLPRRNPEVLKIRNQELTSGSSSGTEKNFADSEPDSIVPLDYEELQLLSKQVPHYEAAEEDQYDVINDDYDVDYEISAPTPMPYASLLDGDSRSTGTLEMPTPARARKNKFHPNQYLPAVVSMETDSSSEDNQDDVAPQKLLSNQLQMSSLSDLEEDDVSASLLLRNNDNS